MNPLFFKSPSDFREWLKKNHKTESELVVGFYKKGSGKANMTWSQSVDEALCFGWIDGIRRSINIESYCIRFTPRKPTSTWSKINIEKVEKLKKKGLMQQSGLIAFANRNKSRSGIYSFENKPAKLNMNFETIFKSNNSAWKFFTNQAPSYQRTIINWIMSAKQDKTRLNRLTKVITESEKQKRVF